MELHIIPECFIDTRLVSTLVPSKRDYNHRSGCTNVEKVMKENFKSDFALEVIDKDKKVLDYLDKCQLVYEIVQFSQLYKHPSENHYLIVIRPAVERWILNTTTLAGLSMLDYELPDDLDKLCDITKKSKPDKADPKTADKFYRLFKAFSRVNPPSVAVLKFRITYLKENPYSADLTYLIAETDRLCQ